MSPKIMNVAAPCSQHSPMFGQRALSQTVCRSKVRISRFRSWKRSPPKNLTRNQSGRGCTPGGGTGIAGELERILKGEAMESTRNLYFTRFSPRPTNDLELWLWVRFWSADNPSAAARRKQIR